MTGEEVRIMQRELGLNDCKLAKALGTRQTIRNVKIGGTITPVFGNALKWLVALQRLDPANDNLPEQIKQAAVVISPDEPIQSVIG